MSDDDYVDLSNVDCHLFPDTEYPVHMWYTPSCPSFPPHTRGYFYYVTSATYPTATELRFRIVERRKYRSLWWLGRDLLAPTGLPWSIPFLSMVNRKGFEPLLDMMTAENNMSIRPRERAKWEDLVDKASAHLGPLRPKDVYLHWLTQPFVYSFGGEGRYPNVFVVQRSAISKMPQVFNQAGTDYTRPNEGSAIFRFETEVPNKDRLQGSWSGTPSQLTIRCLRILEPFKYSSSPLPRLEIEDDDRLSFDERTLWFKPSSNVYKALHPFLSGRAGLKPKTHVVQDGNRESPGLQS